MSLFQAWLSAASLRYRLRALKARRRGSKAELAAIRQHLRSGDIACDIGANKGSFIYWLSRWVGNGRVVAFEPQPELAQYLQGMCRTMGLANVTVEAKAAYSHSGQQDLYVPKGHQPGASLTHTMEAAEFSVLSVPVVALDDYFQATDRIALLKIDVEGAELAVFKGAERILRNQSPLLVFECENRHLAAGSKVEDVFSYLHDLGYEGSFVCHDRLLPVAQFDAAVHQRQDGEWFFKSKDYCNNFIFRKVTR